MPHCIIEHSSNLDGASLVPLVYEGALVSDLFNSEGSDIKVRALSYDHYQTGSVNISFVHVSLRILSGRSSDQKSHLSGLVLEKLKTLIGKDCSLSVEVIDMDRDSYSKTVL